MIATHKATALRYLGAVAFVAAATALRALADPILGDRQPFAVYLLAVIVAARFCGLAPSLLTLFLGAVASRYFFQPPRGSFLIAGLDRQASVFFFLLCGGFFAWLIRSEGRSKEEARRQAQVAIQRQQQLEQEMAERKHVEAELQASQDRFNRFMDDGPFAAFLKDENNRYVYVNKFVEQVLGREQADFLGKTDRDIYPSEVAAEYLSNDLRTLEENSSLQFLEKGVSLDGTIRNWSSVKFPLRDGQGQRLLGGVSIDVTDMRRAEREVKESAAHLLLALEAGRLGIWSWDLTTNRVRASETQAVIHGRSPDQRDSSIHDSQTNIHPEDVPLVQDAIARAARNEAPEKVTYRVVWPADGSVHWIEAVGRVFCDAAGNPNRVMGVCADITEQKLADIALRAREAELRERQDELLLALDAAQMGTWSLDLRTRAVTHSETAEAMLGYAPGELAGGFEAFLAAVHPDDRAGVQDSIALRLRNGTNHQHRHPFRVIWRDGRIRWLESQGKPYFDTDGRPLRMIGVTTDITDLKEAHDSLTHERELLRNLIEVQEKEKQFLCHEFHDGLIQYAVGSLMLLESCRDEHAPTPTASVIDTVIDNLRQGIEDGRRVIRGIRPAVLDDSGLEAALEDLIGQFSTSGMLVTSQCPPDIGRLPDLVQTTIYRVVQEVLSNARRHSGTDVVRIELKKINGDLHLDIRDFGCGFDVLSARKQGFGLLGITERVRLLGGECRIQSERDSGTHVFVQLPIPIAE